MVLNDPDILQCEDNEPMLFEDNGEVEYLIAKNYKDAFDECYELFLQFRDWDDGDFNVSMTEYRNLPCKYLDARRIYRSNVNRGKGNGRNNNKN